ncbi:conserved hypothetical protein [Uncinocarpus reesii 1704]|uniref:LRR-containing protein second PH domain-containing protein n=1 Tax=Uncinocarpus reesii (strain UAMH 1704) TaxID=336963 RepID=C4JNN6_UNCRE|nr:uncharacterized protein UREG_03034 [Uncinocarpus reesii 1704]EEP78189.1 conserved hypothetical protein [Uncinocarpus reesii 1704]
MAEEAKKVKRRKSFGLLFGSTGLLGSDGSSATPRPKSHGHTRSSPDNFPQCNVNNGNSGEDEALQGSNITRRRRGSRPRSSGSLLGIIGLKGHYSAAAGETLDMAKTEHRYANRGRVLSNPVMLNDLSASVIDGGLRHAPLGPIPRARSKSLQKSKRNSMFASLRSFGTPADDDQASIRARSKESSEEDDFAMFLGFGYNNRLSLGTQVLHHGEVQTSVPMWRKKSQYLVLTDTHLVRFKSRSKAAEAFPTIPAQWGRNTNSTLTSNRLSVVSLASLQDSPLPGGGEGGSGIALNRILALHKLDDGRPFFSVEVCYMEERPSKISSLQIQLTDPLDAELWRSGIRDAAAEARAADPVPFEREAVEYISRALDQERDYDPYTMSMHRVVRRVPVKPSGRSSVDDNIKLASTPCYLVVGVHKLHILPLYKASNRASMVSLNELDMSQSYGLLSLAALYMQRGDDGIQLVFRLPFKPPTQLHLSSAFSAEIALHIRQRAEFLRPQWIQQPYVLNVPQWLEDQFTPPPPKSEEDDGCFDRTLTAYCAAYDIDASNIRYSIDYACEDAPCFQLLPPEGSKDGKGYSAFELLAVMRALRYNESFDTISFGGVNLDVLQSLYDPYGFDHDAMQTRSNVALDIPGQEQMSVLTQEIRALALKSKTLRRMNFAFCLTRIPTTGKDWVVLNGIKLGDSDLDYLIDAASQKMSQLRALEISHCGISIHDLDLILSTLTAQEATLEAINISGVQGRLSAELFQQQIGYFAHIRKINLSHISRNTGPEPLIAPETLLNWELEELSLSHTVVNDKTVDSIAAYLASGKSSKLRELRLDHRETSHLHVSENRLHVDYSLLFESITQNKTPTHLTMRMMDFQKEDHFRQLIEAMRKNVSLKYLDISKASLPYDAGPETCKALQMMFEDNTTMEELDISGEYAHLDVARFGIGLNLALTGLKKNKTLKVLRIEHQKLGLQGANTLASVLEANDSLLEVYCENNEINLQSFTVLINGLQRNKTLLHLPCMSRDREQTMDKVRREIQSVNKEPKRRNSNVSTAGSIRRTIQAAVNGAGVSGTKLTKPNKNRQSSAHPTLPSPLPLAPPAASELGSPQVQAILQSLGQKWDLEVERLQRYLYRNYTLRDGATQQTGENGNGAADWDSLSDGRPRTATSLSTFLDQFSFETNQERLFLDGDAERKRHHDEANGITLLRPPPAPRKLSDIMSIPSPDPEELINPPRAFTFSTDPDTTDTTHTLAAPIPAHPRPTAIRTETSSSLLSGISSNASLNTSSASATTTHRPGSTSKVPSASSSLRGILSPRTQADRVMAKNKAGNRVSVTFAQAPRLELDLPSLDLS